MRLGPGRAITVLGEAKLQRECAVSDKLLLELRDRVMDKRVGVREAAQAQLAAVYRRYGGEDPARYGWIPSRLLT